jgi:uncharacterized protein YegL
MQETVESVSSEVKRQINEDIEHKREQKFDIVEISNQKHTYNRELLSLWYPQVYECLFDAVDMALRSPIYNMDDNSEKVYNSLLDGINDLVDNIGSSECDVQALLNIRDRVREFQDNDNDEITIVVKIHGKESSVSYYDQYYSDGIVTVHMNGDPTNPEESTLREYEGSLLDNLCSYTPNECRPTDRYKRELHISLTKTQDSDIATIDLISDRVEYTALEKLFMKIGFSSPYAKEPIKDLV